MTRHAKTTDDFTRGNYSVTKPHGSFVVRLGQDVIFANPDIKQIEAYLDMVSPKR